jgi:hypothetical protein
MLSSDTFYINVVFYNVFHTIAPETRNAKKIPRIIQKWVENVSHNFSTFYEVLKLLTSFFLTSFLQPPEMQTRYLAAFKMFFV